MAHPSGQQARLDRSPLSRLAAVAACLGRASSSRLSWKSIADGMDARRCPQPHLIYCNMPTTKGSCHCGQTEWEVTTEEAPAHVLCHCMACKKLSGGEYTLNIVVPSDDCKVTKGELSKYTYKGDSGNDVICYYCPNCTTHPWHHQTVQGNKYVVRSGLLEGASEFSTAAEVYGKDRWSFQPQVAHTFPVAPPS
ncbi:hypothetical protein Dda_5037 [Drechslerella dactyloides]|uniref:CENP-V/GFA domain-containing protein n=1 Tax=Drechslerella dactyloides TaxID=74499 RepID=A0AAD6IYU4_DREDA|nr:hypothetical protein Dda_5037 [Drechslerella dactyloides]